MPNGPRRHPPGPGGPVVQNSESSEMDRSFRKGGPRKPPESPRRHGKHPSVGAAAEKNGSVSDREEKKPNENRKGRRKHERSGSSSSHSRSISASSTQNGDRHKPRHRRRDRTPSSDCDCQDCTWYFKMEKRRRDAGLHQKSTRKPSGGHHHLVESKPSVLEATTPERPAGTPSEIPSRSPPPRSRGGYYNYSAGGRYRGNYHSPHYEGSSEWTGRRYDGPASEGRRGGRGGYSGRGHYYRHDNNGSWHSGQQQYPSDRGYHTPAERGGRSGFYREDRGGYSGFYQEHHNNSYHHRGNRGFRGGPNRYRNDGNGPDKDKDGNTRAEKVNNENTDGKHVVMSAPGGEKGGEGSAPPPGIESLSPAGN